MWSRYKKAYSGLPKSVWYLCLVTLANRMGTMVLPFLPLYLTKQIGMLPIESGKIMGAYGVGGVLGAYGGGWLSSKVNSIFVMHLSLFLGAIVMFCLPQLDTFYTLLGGFFLLGVFAEAFRPASVAIMMSTISKSQRSRAFALFRMFINVAMTIGPAVGGFLALSNYDWLFYVDGATYLMAIVVLFAITPVLRSAAKKEVEVKEGLFDRPVWKDSGMIVFLLLQMPALFVFLQVEVTYPLYLKEWYGLNESYIGGLYAVNTILIILFEMVLIHALENQSVLKWYAIGVIVMCIGFGITVFGSSYWFVAFAVAVWTVGEMLCATFGVTYVSSRATQKTQGAYMGWYTANWSLSHVITPIVALAIYQWNPHAIWYLCFGIGAFQGVSLWWFTKSRFA